MKAQVLRRITEPCNQAWLASFLTINNQSSLPAHGGRSSTKRCSVRKRLYSFLAILCFVATTLLCRNILAQQPAATATIYDAPGLKVGLVGEELCGAEIVSRFTISPLNKSSSEVTEVRMIVRHSKSSKAKFRWAGTPPLQSEIKGDYREFVWNIGAMPAETQLSIFGAVSSPEPVEMEIFLESASHRPGPWLIEFFSQPVPPDSLLQFDKFDKVSTFPEKSATATIAPPRK